MEHQHERASRELWEAGACWTCLGSASGQPIAVMAHELETTSPGADRNAAFNGSNR